jgi:hypothetical protein
MIWIHLHESYGVSRLPLHPRHNLLIGGNVVLFPRPGDLGQGELNWVGNKKICELGNVVVASKVVLKALDQAFCEAECEQADD